VLRRRGAAGGLCPASYGGRPVGNDNRLTVAVFGSHVPVPASVLAAVEELRGLDERQHLERAAPQGWSVVLELLYRHPEAVHDVSLLRAKTYVTVHPGALVLYRLAQASGFPELALSFLCLSTPDTRPGGYFRPIWPIAHVVLGDEVDCDPVGTHVLKVRGCNAWLACCS
jgi:hypothetical protein